MNFSQRFTFLFSVPSFDADDLEGLHIQQIIAAIERMGLQQVDATGPYGAHRRAGAAEVTATALAELWG